MISWTPNAFYYDFGRPLPRQQVLSLFTDFFKTNLISSDADIEVYEPCAGTGRILTPLATQFPQVQFSGCDYSAGMIDVLKYRIICESITNLKCAVGDAMQFKPDRKVDLLIISSALHVFKEWECALDIWRDFVKPNGYICFVGEEADLYNQALGRTSTNLDNDHLDKNLKSFWEKYLAVRNQVGANNTESSQIGISWEMSNQQPAAMLLSLGYTETATTKLQWIQSFTIEDFLKIIQERCYSSMFSVDEKKYQHLIEKILIESQAMFQPNLLIKSRHLAQARFFQK